MEKWLFGYRYENIKIIAKKLLLKDNLEIYKGYVLWKDLNIRILENEDVKIIFEDYDKIGKTQEIDQIKKYKINKIDKIEKKEIKKENQQYVIRIITGKIVKDKDKRKVFKQVNGLIGNNY